jgi:hypothetical protein
LHPVDFQEMDLRSELMQEEESNLAKGFQPTSARGGASQAQAFLPAE